MALGLNRRKHVRHTDRLKALPSSYPQDGPLTIEQAYNELTHHAFAVWMRLSVATEQELKSGRGQLSKTFGYSEGRFNAVMRELKRRGYITWITSPGLPSECVILRRAIIRAKSHFVRLSRVMSEPAQVEVSPIGDVSECHFDGFATCESEQPTINCDYELFSAGDLYEMTGFHQDFAAKSHVAERRVFYPHSREPKNRYNPVPQNLSLVFLRTYARILTHIRSYSYAHGPGLFTHTRDEAHSLVCISAADLPTIRAVFRSKNPREVVPQKDVSRRKFVSEIGYVHKNELPVYKSASYREKIAQRVLIESEKRKLVRAKRGRENPAKIDFSKLDHRGDPAISFDPDSALREQMIETLARPARDSGRKALLDKLGAEFGRIYVRYRRQAERQLGMRPSVFAYDIPDKEKPYAIDAAMWCVIKGVTPRDLLEYWHKHIRTFADKGLKIPPLALLRSPGMVDQVACRPVSRGAPEPEHESEKSPKKKTDPRPEGRNSFSDSGALDRRLRRGLERAGFDTQDYSDRYLMTIQQLAIGSAKKHKIYVPTQLKPMVEWAAKSLFAEGV